MVSYGTVVIVIDPTNEDPTAHNVCLLLSSCFSSKIVFTSILTCSQFQTAEAKFRSQIYTALLSALQKFFSKKNNSASERMGSTAAIVSKENIDQHGMTLDSFRASSS
jgi:hypothetical protein